MMAKMVAATPFEDQLITGAIDLGFDLRFGYRCINMYFGSQLTVGVPNLDCLREGYQEQVAAKAS